MLLSAAAHASLIWKKLSKRSCLLTLKDSETWSTPPRKHFFAIIYRQRSSGRLSDGVRGQHSSTLGKREGRRRRWPKLVKPRNEAWTKRSQRPVFRLPRMLFGFDCKP